MPSFFRRWLLKKGLQELESKVYIFLNETNIDFEMVDRAENKNYTGKKSWFSGENFKLDDTQEMIKKNEIIVI